MGAEGIIWPCVAPPNKLESGAFYLDRLPQAKHMAGPFFSEGSYTKNTKEEVDNMMGLLESWSNGGKLSGLADASTRQSVAAEASKSPLEAMKRTIDVTKFM